MPDPVEDLNSIVAAGRTFGTIMADPPWAYGNHATRGSATRHYGTMSLDALKALPVADLAAKDSHLHLWATMPLLPDALTLLAAWGFAYRSALVWDKERFGTGNYYRVQTELLLLGIRGQATCFRRKDLRNVVRIPRGLHSCKPEEVRYLIEQASPGPYLELFGRDACDGWTVFGNEWLSLVPGSTHNPAVPSAGIRTRRSGGAGSIAGIGAASEPIGNVTRSGTVETRFA
jgi:N6-adenosine-specific RNA methylase IME4